MRHIKSLLLCLLGLAALAAACSNTVSLSGSAATLLDVTVSPPVVAIAKGTSQRFTASATFSDGTSRDVTASATWSDDNAAIATVQGVAQGAQVVSGITDGSTHIIATLMGRHSAATLVVTNATLSALAITPPMATLAQGTTQQLSVIGTFSDGSTQDLTSQAAWSSDSSAIATMAGGYGVASAVAQGTTNLYASVGGLRASTAILVTNATLTSIAVTSVAPAIAKGTTMQFVATGAFSDSTTQDLSASVAWGSSKPDIAAMGAAAGLFFGAAPGSVTISALQGGVIGTTSLTVTNATLSSITVTPSSPSIAPGATQVFVATGTYSDNSPQDISSLVTWSTGDSTIATISNAGGAHGLATASQQEGTCSITAMLGAVQGSAKLTVSPPPSCDPSLNQGSVADSCGVFVSTSGGGAGSKTSPFTDLSSAFAAAAAAGATGRVYACAATFDGAVRVPAGITLYGGLACDGTWAPTAGKTTISAAAGLVPLSLAAGSAPTTLFDTAAVANTALLPGGSSIAMIASGAVATLARCSFTAGNGADGSSGADGDPQSPQAMSGSAGAAACGNQSGQPFPPSGGAGGSNVIGGLTLVGGTGGTGGLAPNGNGQPGQPGDFGSGALPGQPGLAGAPGSNGVGGMTMGQISESGFQGADGTGGSSGTNGSSGGGGSGAKAGLSCNGASGGGGGAGAGAGAAGGSGKAGGSSIAILSLGSTLTLSSVLLSVGNGGQGGRGGDGQPGQSGGAGGAGGTGAGGLSGGAVGGAGGAGGTGGSGGGGAGGHALGIAFTGSAPGGTPVLQSTGSGGLGGSGGSNGLSTASAGASGLTAAAQGF